MDSRCCIQTCQEPPAVWAHVRIFDYEGMRQVSVLGFCEEHDPHADTGAAPVRQNDRGTPAVPELIDGTGCGDG